MILGVCGGIAVGLRVLDQLPPWWRLDEPRTPVRYTSVQEFERLQRTRLLLPFVFPDSLVWPPTRVTLSPGAGRPVLIEFARADGRGIGLALAQALDGDVALPERIVPRVALTPVAATSHDDDTPVTQGTDRDGRQFLQVSASSRDAASSCAGTMRIPLRCAAWRAACDGAGRMRTTSHSYRTRSIRGRVMVLVGTGLTATMALMGYLAWRTQRDLAREVVRQRETMVHALADELDDKIERFLAQLYGVGDLAARPDVRGASPRSDDGRQILRSAFLSLDEFDAMVVADADGAIRSLAPAGAEVAPAIRALASVRSANGIGLSSDC